MDKERQERWEKFDAWFQKQASQIPFIRALIDPPEKKEELNPYRCRNQDCQSTNLIPVMNHRRTYQPAQITLECEKCGTWSNFPIDRTLTEWLRKEREKREQGKTGRK